MLSVCILHKDEVLSLVRAIRSVLSIADEIIIIDSGSESIDYVAKIFAKVSVIPYGHRAFSYSIARNMAKEYATGDWILTLDSDEELVADQERTMEELMEHDYHSAYAFIVVNYFRNGLWGNFPITKLFPRMHDVIYEKEIHETVNYSLARKGIIPRIVDVFINHYGYIASNKSLLEKQTRYISLLEKQLVDTPNDAASYWYLSASYFAIGNTEKAYANVHMAQKISCQNKIPWIFESRFLIAEGRYGDAIDMLVTTHEIPTGIHWNPTIMNLLGMSLIMQGKYEEAKEALMSAYVEQRWAVNIIANIAVCHLHLGLREEAKHNCVEAIAMLPDLLSINTVDGQSNPLSFQQDVSVLFDGFNKIYHKCC